MSFLHNFAEPWAGKIAALCAERENAKTSAQRKKLSDRIRSQRLAHARAIGTHTAEEWGALLNEFGQRCVRCGIDGAPLDKDHIVPIYQGGSDAISNIQPCCPWCNYSKGADSTNWVEIRRSEGF